MKRVVAPEWLDELPPIDPAARACRRDLQRLNLLMGHSRLIANALKQLFPRTPPARLAELGCGDGTLMLRVARRTGWHRVQIILVDLHPAVSPETIQAFTDLDWIAEPVKADVTSWLPKQTGLDTVIANLFLHHLDDQHLRCLFSAAARASKALVACEPRRSRGRELASQWLYFLGANAVTRHDAPISVRAGFSGRELSDLWPDPARAIERRAGLFTHLFVARTQGP